MFNVGGDAVREIILKWHNTNENEKEKIIYAIFNNINQEYDLNVKLETVMPEGYETANGMTDVSKNKVYINLSEAKRDNTIMPLFALVHEMRHVIQYRYKEKFSPLLVRSMQYAIMYDGHAYKLVDGNWIKCKLPESEEYCTELYLMSPNEVDANKFAYEYLLDLVPEWKDELDKVLDFWLPKYKYIKKENVEFELERIYDYIDKNAR